MTPLIELRSPRPRFARSINVERDVGSSAIDGYLPVGRAIDVISRLCDALDRDDVEVAISVTGPYGSGKSSLAVVIDALLAPKDDAARRSAESLLNEAAPAALQKLQNARRRLGADDRGFVRAVATAQREPIVATILRALVHGAERFTPGSRQTASHRQVLTELRKMQDRFSGPSRLRPDVRQVRGIVRALAEIAPVLLLIDEFGKNLEAFADSHSDADLFLLQELAEWSRGSEGIPIALVTLQHMTFDDYSLAAGASQRREWTKIQGRFEDVPFVDSPRQTRGLIAASFESQPAIEEATRHWAITSCKELSSLGLTELGSDPSLVAACWPLHPIAIAILPELCERYGQNERTLFSFLASREPLSVGTWLAETNWDRRRSLPVLRLDRVYDYFLESASGMVAVSTAASRWVEIDGRIREARGLSEGALRVLKTVGLLNLVSAGGTLRASKAVVVAAAASGGPGTERAEDVVRTLGELELSGLVTYRDFADEYRIWQGSDFDLKSSIDLSRRRQREQPAASLLRSVLPLEPVVASRHSHRSGTLRAFARVWVSQEVESIDPLVSGDKADGTVVYVLGDQAPTAAVNRRSDGKPVVFVTTRSPDGLIAAAREVGAIDQVLRTSDGLVDDWVARRELIERRVEAQVHLAEEFEAAYGANAQAVRWQYLRSVRAKSLTNLDVLSASQAVSDVCDVWYRRAPIIRNDLVNRHELSSQAAKARRLLLEAAIRGADQDSLGIQGHGPDNTLYRSVLRELGLHTKAGEPGGWAFVEPESTSTIRPAWDRIVDVFTSATDHRVRVSEVYGDLAAPPFGVRAGLAPIICFVALILQSDEVALYEHGTFRAKLTADLVERLLRNPGNFEIKYFASRSGVRADFLTHLARALDIGPVRSSSDGRVTSVISILSHLISLTNSLPDYTKRTSFISEEAKAVRRELLTATEPDELLFLAIPRALGLAPIVPGAPYSQRHLVDMAKRIARIARELQGAYQGLLGDLRHALEGELRGPPDRLRESLCSRAKEIEGKVIDPRLGRLVVAMGADIQGDDEWTEYVAMSLTGIPAASWTDAERTVFMTLVRELGGTFRRIEALNADLRSKDGPFDALRVTVTRPDGTETAKLVWLDASRREAASEGLAELLTRLGGRLGNSAEARDVLLALLADEELEPIGHDITAPPTSRAYSGTKSRRKGSSV